MNRWTDASTPLKDIILSQALISHSSRLSPTPFVYKGNKGCGGTLAQWGVGRVSTPQSHVIRTPKDDRRMCERWRSCNKSMINAFHLASRRRLGVGCTSISLQDFLTVLFLSPALGVMNAITTLSFSLICLNQTSNHPEWGGFQWTRDWLGWQNWHIQTRFNADVV